MKNLILVGIVAATVLLSGCVSNTVMAYAGDERPLDEVAVLTVNPNSRYMVGISSYVEAGTGEDFEHVGGPFVGYPREMHLLPGQYVVMLHCSEYDWFAWPQFRITAVAGMSWRVDCRRVPDQPSNVEAVVWEVN